MIHCSPFSPRKTRWSTEHVSGLRQVHFFVPCAEWDLSWKLNMSTKLTKMVIDANLILIWKNHHFAQRYPIHATPINGQQKKPFRELSQRCFSVNIQNSPKLKVTEEEKKVHEIDQNRHWSTNLKHFPPCAGDLPCNSGDWVWEAPGYSGRVSKFSVFYCVCIKTPMLQHGCKCLLQVNWLIVGNWGPVAIVGVGVDEVWGGGGILMILVYNKVCFVFWSGIGYEFKKKLFFHINIRE